MVTSLPEDILYAVLDKIPVTFDVVGQRKLGWEYLGAISRVSKRIRQVALKRWFSILKLREAEDWKYLSDNIWIAELVREFHCSKECWNGCFFSIRYASINPDIAINLNPNVLEVATSFSRLQALVFDLQFARPERATEVFLIQFIKLLPSRVAAVTLRHSPVISEAGLFDILANLPYLRMLDLGSCVAHCSCPPCTQPTPTGQKPAVKVTQWVYHPEFDLEDFAEKMPRLPYLQKVVFNIHLTRPHWLADHINNHGKGLSVQECAECPYQALHETQVREKNVITSLGKTLPALKFVQLCSWGKVPRMEYVIRGRQA